jgi:hypothetical protein
MLQLGEIDLGRVEIFRIGRNAHRRAGVALAAIADAAQRFGDEAGAESNVMNAAAAPDLDFQPGR